MGFDVHAFAGEGPIMLGGIQFPHSRGLAGHSDADVVLHAITDALLGAAASAISASISHRPIRSGKAPPRRSSSPMLRSWFATPAASSTMSTAP